MEAPQAMSGAVPTKHLVSSLSNLGNDYTAAARKPRQVEIGGD